MIRHLFAPLCLMVLIGCADVREHVYPDQTLTFRRDENIYAVDLKFHPAGANWVARVWSIHRDLTAEDRDLVFDLVEHDVGPVLCDGDPLQVEPGARLNPLSGEGVMYFPTIGEWRLIGSCT